MHNGYKTFEDIKAWQLGRSFRYKMYRISEKFPKHELYCLASQIRRAALSITLNIAEGFGRYTYKENANFCIQSRGSTNEVLDCLIIALDEKYISEQEFNTLYNEGRNVEHATNGYISFLRGQMNTSR